MTQHPCRGLLNVPHASLTVTHPRMPGSDRYRTKGAVVFRYVPSLLPSIHPPILCLPLRETAPSCFSRAGAVWLIWMWWGGWVCRNGGPWWVRTQQAVLGGCALFLPLFLPAPGGVLPASTCSPEVPCCLSRTITTCHADYLPTQGKEADMCVGQGGW